jgi:manganese/zinc/iron transport system substrate-binding protein
VVTYRRGRRTTLLALGLAALLALVALAAGCAASAEDRGDVSGRQIRVVGTTNIITDLARVVGGDRVEVTGLMGPGVDPHLYKASAGDVETLREADLILYGGLELEGRMADLLEELSTRTTTVPVTRDIPPDRLRTPTRFQGKFDPHVWFDVDLWRFATRTVADAYTELDPANAAGYRRRADAYLAELDALNAYVRERVATVPPRQRVLVTSHDAFGYFAEAYGFEVAAIQGTSTSTEATTADIARVAGVIADRRLRSVFVESSVPRQTIDAVLAAAAERGQRAQVGGELYGDAAGDPGTVEGTYLGMFRHNVDLIAGGLR